MESTKTLGDEIAEAARRSRQGQPPEYSISDRVDQMVILHEILEELREIRKSLVKPL